MVLDAFQYALGVGSGVLVGFSLGLAGGGGSILAVPLMIYVVGVQSPHVAIGTSALAVAANAGISLVSHARAGNVKWRAAGLFAGAGVAGAVLGAMLGKAFDAHKLLLLFALLMCAVGVLMLRGRADREDPGSECNRQNIPKVLGFGFGTGGLAGFFGIGGGFLIVPGLVISTGMATLNAIGSSLVAVTAFGITTALSYAFSGLVDWQLTVAFIVGGTAGSVLGAKAATCLSRRKGVVDRVFAGLIFVVAAYMIWRSYADV